jgi:hypothetical protein
MNNPLTEIVLEMVESALLEATTRTGPRTGAFNFDETILDGIATRIFQRRREIGDLAKQSDKGFDQKFPPVKFNITLNSPIDGKPKKIPVILFWDSDSTISGWYEPYDKKDGGKISFNVAQTTDQTWIRSIITHELTHYFDKQKTVNNSSSLSNEEYFTTPREQAAFLNQINFEMARYAKTLATKIVAGGQAELMFGETLTRKPWFLFGNLIGKSDILKRIVETYYKQNKPFMKKIYQACYDIVQGFVVPAILERQKTFKALR